MKMYFLGLDIATFKTGWCVAKVDNHSISTIQKGTLFLPESASLPERLHELHNQIASLKSNYSLNPTLFKEQPLHSEWNKNISAAMFKAHGVIESVFHDFKMFDVSPTEVKKIITGKGRASKQLVENGVRNWLNLPTGYKFDTDDESDAVGILITGLLQKKIIEK